MFLYYCKKCGTDNPTPVCGKCGKALNNSALRFMWNASRIPAMDGVAVRGVLRVLLYAVLLLLFGLFAAEYLISGLQSLVMLSQSDILMNILYLYIAGAFLGLLLMALQGREEVRYVLDPKGAHLQTWIYPTRIRCWSRFLSYNPRLFLADQEGNFSMLVRETHLLWADVRRVEMRTHASRIDLFRPSGFLFMVLRLSREEYDQAAALVESKTKHAGK